MSTPTHSIRWELHENPYRSLSGCFVYDDASIDPESCGFRVVRVLADALTLPLTNHPEPDCLLAEAITPWLHSLLPANTTAFHWSRAMYPRNRVGRHRAASDVRTHHAEGRAAASYEHGFAVESHSLSHTEDLHQAVFNAPRARSGSLVILNTRSVEPRDLLEHLITLRTTFGERLRLQHLAEALTPLGTVVLSREWDDGGESSREIALSRAIPLMPLPSEDLPG